MRPKERCGDEEADILVTCPGMEPGTDEGPGATLSRSFSAFRRSTSSCGESRVERPEMGSPKGSFLRAKGWGQAAEPAALEPLTPTVPQHPPGFLNTGTAAPG